MDGKGSATFKERIRAAQIVVACADVSEGVGFLVDQLGFKVSFIYPADNPMVAVLVGHGACLRLERDEARLLPETEIRLLCDRRGPDEIVAGPHGLRIRLVDANPPIEVPAGRQSFVLTKAQGEDRWGAGRAGMLYRDLIPDRMGGRFIASHIRIPNGGPVPDYVHFHRVRFQMIFCRAGWVKVVYEDQGEPFVMRAGDCVLQPPEIRHRVLESSAGLEVIEIGCPAVHETHADHVLSLPTGRCLPQRAFAGQRFQRHVAAETPWNAWRAPGFEAQDTGIGGATQGLAGARVVRPRGRSDAAANFAGHEGEFLFWFVLKGEMDVDVAGHGRHGLKAADCCLIPAGLDYALAAKPELELLEVALPADSGGQAR